MRGVSALARAMEHASPDTVSLVVIWEPVILSDRRPPGRSVTQPIATLPAQRFWDGNLLASKSVVRTALKHPEQLPAGVHIDESFIVWDIVALWPPGARWDDDMPLPEWFDSTVVDAEAELTTRLSALSRTDTPTP